MKLGEALSERANLQKKISDLRNRIELNAATEEGPGAGEDANTLLAELEEIHTQLQLLITRINLRNAGTFVENVSLTELLARRDRLASLISTYVSAADAGQKGPKDRFYRSGDLKIERHVDVAALRRKADETREQLRVLDNQIQEVNWATEL